MEAGREGGREAQEGGDIDIIMTDSYCYMAETNTTLQSSYTPIKKKRNALNSYLRNKLLW